MRKHKWRLIIYVSLISFVLLYIYGRSLWSPVKLKPLGKKTLEEVCQDLEVKHGAFWHDIYKGKEIDETESSLYLIALKQERRLELWAKTPNKAIHLINFPFTGSSGQLGPKLREGDGQIPEGIYKITSFNPNSAYHLSLKINYPNNFDQESAKTDGRTNLGSNIFIHGNSLSIGCIPIGDENIEKLFFLVHKVGLANTKLLIAPNDIRIEKNLYKDEVKPWIKHKYQRLHNELKPFNNTPWQ